MKVLPRVKLGDPILRKRAKSISPKRIKTMAFRTMTRRMFFTMRRDRGIGLAAPQIGQSVQLAVIEINPSPLRPNLKPFPRTVIVNPRVIRYSKERKVDWEGCLSFKSFRGKVSRSQKVTVEYLDEFGKKQVRGLTGFPARVFQHEIDHLAGIVYLDRMETMRDIMTLGEFKKRILRK